MNLLLPSFFVLGSYSIGYGLIRIGFPNIQNKTIFEKIAIGYLGGIILFGLAFVLLILFELDTIYYTITTTLVFILMGFILFIKRLILNETDPIIEETNKYFVPGKNKFNMDLETNNKTDSKKIIKKEQSNKTNKPSEHLAVKSSEELLVKTRNKEREVFKDKNVINTENQQKENIMSKLREYAQEINSDKKQINKKKKSEENEEEDELVELIEYDF